MLINKSIPNLIGGISQQAPNIRLANQAERQENFNSSLVNGLQSRPRMKLVTKEILDEGLFAPVDRDEVNAYNVIVNPTELQVIEPDGTINNVSLSADALTYLALEEGHTPDKYYKTLTLADYTFILNKERTVAMTEAQSGEWTNQAMVFIKAVNYTTTWSLVINGITQSVGYGGTDPEGKADLYVNGSVDTADAPLSSITVATKLAGIALTGFQIIQSGSTIRIKRLDGAAFTIGLTDSRSDTCAALVTSRVQKFADLPTVAPDGYIVRVLGDSASTSDDYYVKFVANVSGEFGKGVWEETVSPGMPIALDAKTMPWVLVNNSGSWSFHTFEWAERKIGNEETNPTPQFVGSKIKNLTLFRNRLCFLAEDIFCMSAAAEHDNWWNATSFALTDSDPIYLSASTDGIKELYDFGIMQETLVIFSETGQYSLQTPDVLSPKTAALLPLSSDAFTPDTGIVPSGSRLYFGHSNSDWYNCMEFGINSVTGLKEATSITTHVPSYIPKGTEMQLVGSASVSTLVVRTSGASDCLFIYQYYIDSGSKLQASWHKYSFKGAVIKGCFFRNQILWLHVIVNGVAFIATIDMTDRQIGTDFEYCLDYITPLATETPVETTAWILPAELRDSEVVVLYTLTDGTVTLNPVVSVDTTTGAMVLQYPATDIICGIPYKRLYEFSTQYITKGSEGKKVNITSGRWMLQRLVLTCEISGKFDVVVKPNFDDASEGYSYDTENNAPLKGEYVYLADNYLYKYTSLTTGQQSAMFGHIPMQKGVFRIPLRGRNTDIRTIISSDSWLPQSFISAEWEGNYTTKIGRQI